MTPIPLTSNWLQDATDLLKQQKAITIPNSQAFKLAEYLIRFANGQYTIEVNVKEGRTKFMTNNN